MKKHLVLLFVFCLSVNTVLFSQITTYKIFDPNNISTWFVSTGIFNQDVRTNNTPGLMWPKGSNRFAIFTSGVSIGAYVNGSIRLASCSYKGEYTPGYCNSGIAYTNSDFQIYKVTRGDGPSDPDWANWFKMIPYGAPFSDINNNGVFDQGIDTPGVKNAQQTIFVCMTDGFPETHTASEGFAGGTAPLFSEMHLTAWGYAQNIYKDIQFVKVEIINKGTSVWNSTYMGIVADPDLGDGNDDYIGCDTIKQLGYCYNGDNMDGSGNPPSYGANPPASGIIMLEGCKIKNVTPQINLKMTSFVYFTNSGSGGILCEQDPTGEPIQAYSYLKGLKNDGSPWFHPFTKKRVKKLYTGNPEAFTGWTERGYNGNPNLAIIRNCAGGDTITAYSSPSGDRRFLINSGDDNLNINPGDTQKIMLCQLVSNGSNYLNSVTTLSQLSDVAWSLYNSNFTIGVQNISTEIPSTFSLSQNYPNPFNPTTKIRFDVAKLSDVKIVVYDVMGREVQTLVNENLQPGKYETTFDGSKLNSGVYFARIEAGSYKHIIKMLMIK